MLEKNWEEFIEKSKKIYKEIDYIKCPAFGGDKVFFNKYGFNHLIWKGRIPRPKNEQEERLSLLPSAIEIVRNSNQTYNYRETTLDKSRAHFWALKGFDGKKNLRIIIRKKNNGPLHFFSVMED